MSDQRHMSGHIFNNFIPGLGANLISIAVATEAGVSIHFFESNVTFIRKNLVVMLGRRIGRTLYHLHISVNSPTEMTLFIAPPPLSVGI